MLTCLGILDAERNGDKMTYEIIKANLADCLQWCYHFKTFRSDRLKEYAEAVFPDSCHTPLSDGLMEKFNQFLQARHKHLLKMQVLPEMIQAEWERPMSLLATNWSLSLFDGALEPETDGFINFDGMPPWDTWVGIFENNLISWVPQWMSKKINNAILIDAAESISWVNTRGLELLLK